MSTTFLALMIGAPVVAGNATPMHRGEAFPVASTLYLGDGGSASHAHSQQSTDCSHGSDAGGGCSDGGRSSD